MKGLKKKKKKRNNRYNRTSNKRISAETCQKQNLIIPVQWTLIIIRDQKPLSPFKGFAKVSRKLGGFQRCLRILRYLGISGGNG